MQTAMAPYRVGAGRGRLLLNRSKIVQHDPQSPTISMSADGPFDHRTLADGFVRSWTWSCRGRQPFVYAAHAEVSRTPSRWR